ncbi:hypothetical protein SAMN05216276_1003203 [Streptosporangium subroseum]|uniref:Uncharacterized protein n=1 Tax=Streptosporangium subroseum TaxID=106412 RepID=A0A239BGJ2_9ACTN|nr:hypothetical protein [Streptosporangium subroseum]SNS07060.1 hypothetical protein SAMN05216276_1003203 [Streptosporangium subroseum]
MPKNAYVVGAGAGLILLVAGVYGLTSLSTISWGVPTFIVGMFLATMSSILLVTKLAHGQGPATGVLGQMKSFMGTGNQDLIGTGVPVRALITSMRDTGTTVNDQVVVAFGLQVQPAGGPPYTVSHRQILPRLLMGAVLPGKLVQVWSDPVDAQRLAIDWSALPVQQS